MKTHVTRTQTHTLKTFGLVVTLFLTSMAWNTLNAQTSKVATAQGAQEGRTIKGVISNDQGPLESASVVLKGTSTGTSTDAKGEFTFPKPLNTGDVLVITFLGFEAQEVKIKEGVSFLKLALTEDLIEFTGALNTDKPYKSKRTKE